jgi:hypothetical protein
MRVLLVDQNERLLRMNANLLRGKGYVVHSVNFNDPSIELPNEHYDAAISSGLNGWGVLVLSSVDADKKILYSSHPIYTRRAREQSLITIPRREPIQKVIGGLI